MKHIQCIFYCFITLSIFDSSVLFAKKEKANQKQSFSQSHSQSQEKTLDTNKKNQTKTSKTSEGSWLTNVWNSTKSTFNKARNSIKQNMINSFSASKKYVNEKWNTASQHYKIYGQKKQKACQHHQKLHHHMVKARQLMEDVKNSDDQRLKNHVQKYYQSARNSNKDAESVKRDLDFALQNVVSEAERIEQINKENLDAVSMNQEILFQYQTSITEAENKKTLQIKKEQRILRKKTKT